MYNTGQHGQLRHDFMLLSSLPSIAFLFLRRYIVSYLDILLSKAH